MREFPIAVYQLNLDEYDPTEQKLLILTKGGVIPAPVPVPVSVFQPMFTPDTGTGTFALESVVLALSLAPAPSVEYLPPY